MKKKWGTHPDMCHADDLFSSGTLLIIYGKDGIEFIRTRNTDILDKCEGKHDVGNVYNNETCEYDHHQPGGAGIRENKIPYASFGLIWKHYGIQACGGDAEAAEIVECRIVQQIDAADNGKDLAKPIFKGVYPYVVSEMIYRFNPLWDDEDQDYNKAFENALEITLMILKREIEVAKAEVRGYNRIVRPAIKTSQFNGNDKRLIILEESCPWREVITKEAPDALFVVFPDESEGWRIQGISKINGSFKLRKSLPNNWAGLNNKKLAAITGVKDAVFCHRSRFIAGTKSREGILTLAQMALEYQKPSIPRWLLEKINSI